MTGRRRVGMAARFGLATGLIVAGAVAAIVTAMEWIQNPGGIYRGPDGTDWRIVLETTWSWFAPLFAAVAMSAGIIRFFLPAGGRRRGEG